MAEYYLISQLPSLDGVGEDSAVPITIERFNELCTSFLSKKALAEFNKLTLVPSKNYEKSASGLIEDWNEGERKLRFVLAEIRADKMNKRFDCAENSSFSQELIHTAREAVEKENPMEAEKFLNRYRLNFLETLRPMDSFSEDYVYYYGIKLKLLSRMRQFDTQSGEIAYKNIYDSVMNAERLEDTQ